MRIHSGSPHHAFTHCGGFVTAAPRGAWTNVSESISGLSLSRPVRITALLGFYPNNKLIRRSPILRYRSFKWRGIPAIITYGVLSPVSQGYPPPEGRLTTCYWAVRLETWLLLTMSQNLAWLSRTLIMVVSGGINRNCGVTLLQDRVSPTHTFFFISDKHQTYIFRCKWNCFFISGNSQFKNSR